MSTDLQLSSTETGDTVRDGDHIFKRCGLACIVDLKSKQWEELFRLMTVEQEAFLVYESRFRSPDYIWPRDALKNWSRVWEYPYTYYHLRNWQASEREEESLTFSIMEVG